MQNRLENSHENAHESHWEGSKGGVALGTGFGCSLVLVEPVWKPVLCRRALAVLAPAGNPPTNILSPTHLPLYHK